MTLGETGAILATLAISVHKIAPPSEALSLRDLMNGLPSRLCRRHASGAHRHGILALIERLAPGTGLSHGDLHPSNVIMTAEGPRCIDWRGATRAPAGLDLAGCHVVLCDLAADIVADPERPRAITAAVQSEYARQAGLSPAALAAAMEPDLPIVHVRVLLGPAGSPALRARLIRRSKRPALGGSVSFQTPFAFEIIWRPHADAPRRRHPSRTKKLTGGAMS